MCPVFWPTGPGVVVYNTCDLNWPSCGMRDWSRSPWRQWLRRFSLSSSSSLHVAATCWLESAPVLHDASSHKHCPDTPLKLEPSASMPSSTCSWFNVQHNSSVGIADCEHPRDVYISLNIVHWKANWNKAVMQCDSRTLNVLTSSSSLLYEMMTMPHDDVHSLRLRCTNV